MTTPDESRETEFEPHIDLSIAVQERILRFERKLESDNHYQLLGVAQQADKKEIKSAYYALMNEFHTDKFYGKNLGSFALRMTRIVKALTAANDVLGRNRTREEYDKYLESRQSTLGARASIAPIPPSAPPEPSGEQPSSGSWTVSRSGAVQVPPAPPAPALEGSSTSAAPSGHGLSTVTLPSRSSIPPPNDARKKRLARKMGGRGGNVDPSGNGDRREAVRADLRARYDARRGAEEERVAHYRQVAADAVRDQSWAAAVNAMRMALSLKPSDAGLLAEFEAVQAEADQALAPKFLEQAAYEEKGNNFERAARSYERAGRGLKSGELFDKGAMCLLQLPRPTDEERRKAVEMARLAVSLDKRKVPYRITLARAYDAAGMKTSALGELRRALELEPGNNEAKELQKRLK